MANKGLELNPPMQITWIISLVIGLFGIVGYLVTIPFVSVYAFWLVVVAFILLVLATLLKDL